MLAESSNAYEISICHYLVLGVTQLGQGLGAQCQDNVSTNALDSYPLSLRAPFDPMVYHLKAHLYRLHHGKLLLRHDLDLPALPRYC